MSEVIQLFNQSIADLDKLIHELEESQGMSCKQACLTKPEKRPVWYGDTRLMSRDEIDRINGFDKFDDNWLPPCQPLKF